MICSATPTPAGHFVSLTIASDISVSLLIDEKEALKLSHALAVAASKVLATKAREAKLEKLGLAIGKFGA